MGLDLGNSTLGHSVLWMSSGMSISGIGEAGRIEAHTYGSKSIILADILEGARNS